MQFQLSNALIRPWRLDDAESLQLHADDAKVARMLRDRFPHPYSLQAARDWLAARVALDEKEGSKAEDIGFAIEVDSQVAGGIGLIHGSDINRLSAEIGFWLGRALWGRGIATEAVKAVTDYALGDLGLARIFAHVLEPNLASCRVLEKAGFVLEGRQRRAAIKHGEILDEFLYARVRESS